LRPDRSRIDFLIAPAWRPASDAGATRASFARTNSGRGFGAAAGLDFGDCFSCALAKVLAAPLLFVGDDFALIDLEPALG
jgi:ribonuclease VapC